MLVDPEQGKVLDSGATGSEDYDRPTEFQSISDYVDCRLHRSSRAGRRAVRGTVKKRRGSSFDAMIRRSRTDLWHVAAVSWVLVICGTAVGQKNDRCPLALFSFGTSLSDTGNSHYVLPDQTFADRPPYGSTFFGHPAKRFSDGRLILDFLASSLDFPFIEPFLSDEAPDYTRGVNFAFSGALALPLGIPYFFDVQVDQFVTFRGRALSSVAFPSLFPTLQAFDHGLYIVFFGRNDLTDAYRIQNFTPSEVLENVVPMLVQVIVDGIQKLYDNGARSFMVFNVNPQGCQPQYMTLFGALDRERDENGCLATYNGVVQTFNSLLREAVQELRTNLTDSAVFYVDFYGICKEVFDSPKQFGFSRNKTLVSCCGTGGDYNYDPVKRCGYHGMIDGILVDVTQKCENPSEYISWDGVHFTEAFYDHVALRILSGKFLDPPGDMTTTCNLDFSSFSKHQTEKISLHPGHRNVEKSSTSTIPRSSLFDITGYQPIYNAV